MDIIVFMRTCRRKEGKREETDATWRCRVSRCMRACVCGLCDDMLVTHERTTLTKIIGTAACQRAQARDLSSMHAPVV